MSTIDRSRQATDPRKHYAGVRMQQGRVLTDDDFNDAAALDADELRRTRVHAIGAYGTPDAGFLPKNLTMVGGKIDFALSTGNLYLGGLRLEMTQEETFLLQKDWLNFDIAVDAPPAPASGITRIDAVWVETWQQPVTAIEDSELFEVALGGPDSSTRWRTMRRIHVSAGVTQSECADAWSSVSAGFAALGTLAPDMELATAATLTVGFTAPPATGDLCSPNKPGGYLGAENQAVRVQMVDATHYNWGFDNGGPVYRVRLSASGGQLVKLTLLNQPKDAVHWPLTGQVVELLPWSAALANGERVAEVAGHLCKVKVSYDPDDFTLEIDTAVPAAFGTQWKTRADKADFFDGSADEDFFFLRVWNRGNDLTSPASIPIAKKALGHTGLEVTFGGGGPLRPADFWIIAARPAAPDVVVPWILGTIGAGIHGIRRYRAPVALLQWTTTGGVTTGTVISDCRPPFLPLTRIRNCCSVTVGDGSSSFGMFTSVQAAIDSLPPSGGTVCILPGRYVEAVLVRNRRNVTLHGCGPCSRLVAPDDRGAKSTVLRIEDSTDVAVETLALEGGTGAVVRVERSSVLRIADCLVQYRDERGLPTVWPALFISADEVEVEGNIVERLPDDLNRIFHKVAAPLRALLANTARGGIQLAGGCEHVRVAGNVIVGGIGNGITLGSILQFDEKNPDGRDVPDVPDDGPCAGCDPVDHGPPKDDPNGGVRFASAGDLYDIDIDDNVITRHGANGIGVVRFFGQDDKGLVLVTVHGLRIAHNRITDCLRRGVAQTQASALLFLGYGGIALAFTTALEIESNVITGNGRDWLTPVCGVFVLATDGMCIERNRVARNGPRTAERLEGAQPGIRAGVHVWLALALGTTASAAKSPSLSSSAVGRVGSGVEQLRVHGNRIEQPLGRALFMLGAGAMAITDNRLVSEGTGARATDALADTVLVGNLGMSREWTQGLLMTLVYLIVIELFQKGGDDKQRQLLCDLSVASRFMPGLWPALPTGKLMFNDNQVSFLMKDAAPALAVSSVMLLSLDDVSACDNQFEFHTQQRLVLADLLAIGSTVRTNDNRLAESWGRAVVSVMSFGLMNTAADNQSTHCIAAYGLMRAVHHNLVLAQAFCDNACGRPDTLLGHVTLAGSMATQAHL